MYPQELNALDELFAYLSKAVVSTQPSVTVTAKHVDAIIQILDRWPSSQRFPGMQCSISRRVNVKFTLL
jgi:phospholipase A-2-activating protein